MTARATADPAALLSKALKTSDTRHRATIAFSQFPSLFKALKAVPAEVNTKLALYWLILTVCRTGEMRFASWGEVDGKLWRIPASRMKMKRDHVVPLSRQAIVVLERAREIRVSPEPEALLFPGFTRHGALSENAMLALLARAGYFGRQTSHGFRSSFSTWSNEEHEAAPDVIEAALAHVQEGVRADYNRSLYIAQRRKLLQAWADDSRRAAWCCHERAFITAAGKLADESGSRLLAARVCALAGIRRYRANPTHGDKASHYRGLYRR